MFAPPEAAVFRRRSARNRGTILGEIAIGGKNVRLIRIFDSTTADDPQSCRNQERPGGASRPAITKPSEKSLRPFSEHAGRRTRVRISQVKERS